MPDNYRTILNKNKKLCAPSICMQYNKKKYCADWLNRKFIGKSYQNEIKVC